MLNGLNHITLAVSDISTSLTFYIDVLGFKGHVKWDSGAYLSLGELWLCLSLDPPDSKSDYSHIALTIADSDFELFSQQLISSEVVQWKVNKSEGQSLYILDPDGHKLEIHSGDLHSRLESLKKNLYKGLVWI